MTTDTIMFIVALLFLSFMALFNLRIAIKEKKGYMPAVVCFLFVITVILIFFEQIFYGLTLFAVIVIISVMGLIKTALKPSESLHGWEEKISKELGKRDCKDPIELKDFFGWAVFVKIAIKYGAKKAAFSFALSIVASISLLLFLFSITFPEIIEIGLGEYIPQIVIGFIFLYYVSNNIFEKVLKDRDKQDNAK